jgi:hypothetical protein
MASEAITIESGEATNGFGFAKNGFGFALRTDPTARSFVSILTCFGPSRSVWERATRLAPKWPGFLPERRDPALAAELKKRSEASLRSWEEADARFEQSRTAAAKASNA